MGAEALSNLLRATHDAHEALLDAYAAWSSRDFGSDEELESMAQVIDALRRRQGELRDQTRK